MEIDMVRSISPAELKGRTDVRLIDVREYPEFAAGAIPGATLVPLATLGEALQSWDRNSSYVMVCKSGKRSRQAAQQMFDAGFRDVFLLAGGTEAWLASGFPVHISEKRPWSLERQVRVAAGTMVLVSALLGITFSPWFFAWTLMVGAGLVFAGVSDICLMASLLGRMPWNRAAACS